MTTPTPQPSEDRPVNAWVTDMRAAFPDLTIVHLSNHGSVIREGRTWHTGEDVQAVQR